MGLSLAVLAGLLADRLLGEPRRGHPLVVFGRLVDVVEARCNQDGAAAGALAAGVLIGGPALAALAIAALLPAALAWGFAAVCLYGCIAARSLAEHTRAVAKALQAEDLAAARSAVGALVSRDTAAMPPDAVCRATIESVLENASDGIYASLFWVAVGGLVFGPAGAAAAVVGHRAANTLDAMWGYRNRRFARFGGAAARVDDAVNYLPARAAALGFALLGDTRAALSCWREQAPAWDSPNAGPLMAAGAGALGLKLGGGAVYHGAWRDRPPLGRGREPTEADIEAALVLVARLTVCCGGLIVALALALEIVR